MRAFVYIGVSIIYFIIQNSDHVFQINLMLKLFWSPWYFFLQYYLKDVLDFNEINEENSFSLSLTVNMSSNKFEALGVSDDSDNSDANTGDSGNLGGKSTGENVVFKDCTFLWYLRRIKLSRSRKTYHLQ